MASLSLWRCTHSADLLIALAIVTSVPLAAPAGVGAQQPAAPPLAFTGVTVVDVRDGKLLPDRTVLVVGNRVRAVGRVNAVRVPRRARVVDARGKYLIPGLWDMHVHFSLPSRNPDVFYPLLVANGVTGVRDPAVFVPLDTVRQWQRAVAAGTRVGPPRQLVSGRPLDWSDGGGHAVQVSPAEVRSAVAARKAEGADFIKLYVMSRDAFFVAAAAARAMHLRVAAHLPAPEESVTVAEASDSGVTSLEHLGLLEGMNRLAGCLGDSATVERCSPLARRLARNGTWIVPTLSVNYMGVLFPERLRPHLPAWLQDAVSRPDSVPLVGVYGRAPGTDPDEPYKPLAGRVLDIMYRAGMPLLAGTDASTGTQGLVAGFSLHSELALLVAKGVTPLGALQAATLNPAKYLGGTDSLGTVAAGKLADLVLLDANPLEDIRNTSRIRAVVANGRYFDRAGLDSLLVEGKAELAWRRMMHLGQ